MLKYTKATATTSYLRDFCYNSEMGIHYISTVFHHFGPGSDTSLDDLELDELCRGDRGPFPLRL